MLDGSLEAFSQQAFDVPSILAMTTGSFSYRLARMGILSIFRPATSSIITRQLPYFASSLALAIEVSVFGGIQRSLTSTSEHHEGGFRTWLTAYVEFATLKITGSAFHSQNPFLTHLFQASSMVLSHQATHTLGLTSTPEGNLLDQLLHAEITNLQMNTGAALFSRMTAGKIHALERSIEHVQHATNTIGDSSFANEDPLPCMATGDETSTSRRRPVQLRPYQQEMLDRLREDLRSDVSPWLGIASPMQTGKSKMVAPIVEMLREELGSDIQIIILSSAKIITDQAIGDLRSHFRETIAQFDARKKEIEGKKRPRIIVASARSLSEHLDALNPNLRTVLINDEAYSTQTETFQRIYEHFRVGKVESIDGRTMMRPRKSNNRVIGFSGTGGGLEAYHVTAQYDLLRAIHEGWIRHMRGDRVMIKIDYEEKRGVNESMIWWKPTQRNADLLTEVYTQRIHEKYPRSLVYVPTIEHGELLLEAFRKRFGNEYGTLLHSVLDDGNFQTELKQWEKNGGPLISIRMMGRGFRATDTGAIFHTYQTTSPEFFAQRTGRAWGKPSREMDDLYVLEVTWNARGSFTNLARLLGLIDYPLELQTRNLGRIKKEQSERQQRQEDFDSAISQGEVSTSFVGIPLEESWRQEFSKVCNASKRIDALSRNTKIAPEILTGYAMGALPVSLKHIEALENLFGGRKKILNLWLGSWRNVVIEILQGQRSILDVFADDLLRWNENFPHGTDPEKAALALDVILQERLPYLQKFYYVRRPINMEITREDRELLDQSSRFLHKLARDAGFEPTFDFQGKDLLRDSLSDGEYRRIWLELARFSESFSENAAQDQVLRAQARGLSFKLLKHLFRRQEWDINPSSAKDKLLYEARRAVLLKYGASLPTYSGIEGVGNWELAIVRRWLAGEKIEYNKTTRSPQVFYRRVRALLEGLGLPSWKVDKLIIAAVFEERGWSVRQVDASAGEKLSASLKYHLGLKSGGGLPRELFPELQSSLPLRTGSSRIEQVLRIWAYGKETEPRFKNRFSNYLTLHRIMIRLGADPSEFVPLLYEHVRGEFETFRARCNRKEFAELFTTLEWLLMKYSALLDQDPLAFDSEKDLMNAVYDPTELKPHPSIPVHKFLHRLTDRQREVIKRRFGLGDCDPHNFEEIGNLFEVSSQRVRQIEAIALRRMRALVAIERYLERRALFHLR